MGYTISASAFHLPKGGLRDDEYEDAYWTPAEHLFPLQPYRCAVADGATETSFSGLWASLLVEAWGTGMLDAEDEDGWRLLLPPLQEAWQDEVDKIPLPWYAEQKARSGAFAALLGLALHGEGVFACTAVGDAELLHVRDGAIVDKFPMRAASEFNSRPALLSSNCAQNEALSRLPRYWYGQWRQGDRFYLATDALACALLQRVEGGNPPWADLDALDGASAFERLILNSRADKTMRNDDVTLIRLVLGEEPAGADKAPTAGGEKDA